ncbi:pectate lyase family protein [Undibacterium sp. RuTC16W]|uniref:pectate lyase family protein n=1 Tax=Undibacterium sp. RuTC16W TaxID=3413048 RepID=UPI003BF36876
MNNKKLRIIALAALTTCGAAGSAYAADWPSGFSKCADEGGVCKVGDKARQVSFGLKDKWVIKSLSGNVSCSAASFGVVASADVKEKCAVGPEDGQDGGSGGSNGGGSGTGTTPAGYSGGFAGQVTGGGTVAPVVVTSAAQMQKVIDAYTGTGGLVIRYSGTFDFRTIPDPCTQWKKPQGAIVEVKNKGNITIEGTNGSAANFGIAVKGGSSNIIIRNMTIGLLPGSIDAIGIEGQSGKFPGYVWVDHNTLFSSLAECAGAGDLEFDGLVDNKAGAHHLTYSYNYIHDHHKVGLIGSSDSDASDRYITFHHNYYKDVGSRVPLQRGGYTHMYNNLYSGLKTSGINVRMSGYALIENNYFENSQNPVTSRDSSVIGNWELRNNNIKTPADFSTYGIKWIASDSKPTRDATDWVTTAHLPIGISYSYTPDEPACVKQKLPAVAGAGTSLAKLSCK